MANIPSEFLSLSRSMRAIGLFPTALSIERQNNDAPKSLMQHSYPLILCCLSWINALRIGTHLIWVKDFNVKQILYSGLILCYFFLGAILRTVFTISNFQYRIVNSFKNLFSNDCPLWKDLKGYSNTCRKTRSSVVRFLHVYSWFYVVMNNSFIIILALIDRQNFANVISPFPYIGSELIFYIGIGVVSLLQISTDTACVFGNTYVATYTIELATKFDIITKWIGEKAWTPGISRGVESNSLNEKFDVENIRMAHLYWVTRVKEFDQLSRFVIGSAMTFGFYGLLVNVFLFIGGVGNASYLLLMVWVSWAVIGSFFLFCHLLSSSHLNKTTTDAVDALFRVPTRNLFKANNTEASFNLLFFVNQCTAEPIALTFFDLFYLRNEAVMAVGLFFYNRSVPIF